MSVEDAMNMSIEDRVAWFRRDLEANPLTVAAMIATADLRFLLDAIDARPSVQPPTREQIDTAVGAVLFNVSNYPEAAQSRLWGRDIGPLREKVTDAVLALFPQPTPSGEARNAWDAAVQAKRTEQRAKGYTADHDREHALPRRARPGHDPRRHPAARDTGGRAVTRVGVVRHRYSRTVEARPSRFSPAYRAWARRADAWGHHLSVTLTMPKEGA